MKRLPPFAKAHAEAARAGFGPANGTGLVLNGWRCKVQGLCDAAQPGSWRALLPDDADPADFEWGWTAGFRALIVSVGTRRLIALGNALEAAGCRDIALLVAAPQGPFLWPWRRPPTPSVLQTG
jgi:hypothetical protein